MMRDNGTTTTSSMSTLRDVVNLDHYPLQSQSLIQKTRQALINHSVITLPNFLQTNAIQTLVQEALEHKHKAFYTKKETTHNIYLTPNNESLPENHIFNRQIVSSKGCIQADQIPHDSQLRVLYYNQIFQDFLQQVLGVDNLFPYEDPLSSINIHFASEGQELGWHFDNSAFAITLLLQKPEDGGVFEYVPNIRHSASDSNDDEEKMGYKKVEKVVNGDETPKSLEMNPGTLVLFRGRDSLHRVTQVVGDRTRVLVVLAYNEKPGVELSEEARMTFFGRTGRVEDR